MKTIILVLTTLLFHLFCFSQKGKKDYIAKKQAFGIVFTGNISNIKITEKDWKQTILKDSISSINILNKTNFGMGFSAETYLNKFIKYRQKWLLSFFESKLNYTGNLKNKNYKADLITTSFPINFLIKMNNNNKHFPYLLTSINPSFNLIKKIYFTKNQDQIQLTNFDLSTSIGLGFQFNKKEFNTSIELEYCKSLSNSLNSKIDIISKSISKIYYNYFQLNLVLSGLILGEKN